MTGEINIGGAVSAIGGLEHKLNGAKEAGVRFVFVCKKNLDDVKKLKKSNASLFNLINPNNDADVEKVITTLCKKKHSNTGNFKIMVIETIYDIIPYALVDPAYVEEHYDDKYDTYGVTCDITKFMIEDPDEFIENGRIEYHAAEVNDDEIIVNEEYEIEDLDDVEDDHTSDDHSISTNDTMDDSESESTSDSDSE